MTKHVPSAARPAHAPEPESMDDLRQDCARMSARWSASTTGTTARAGVSHSHLHGVQVPERSARLLDGMSDYGD